MMERYGAKPRDDYDGILKELVEVVQYLYSCVEHTDFESVVENKEMIVVLDYLVTAYQLVSLSALRSLSEFNRKSKIEAVVEGNPVKVTVGHVRKIREKLELLQIV